jgi:hypothetical protein
VVNVLKKAAPGVSSKAVQNFTQPRARCTEDDFMTSLRYAPRLSG